MHRYIMQIHPLIGSDKVGAGGNELCQNTIGSYRCGCMQGYIKDDHNQHCIDFDECEQGTHTCHAESQV